jgi:protein gp37
MAENSKIEWTDHTFNPWIGCTKVSPGCDNCYAKANFDDRKHRAKWGPGQPRSRTKTWGDPVKWNARHAEFFAQHGRRQRVFCASLADVFDNEVPAAWRQELVSLIVRTPNLDWLLLTKRIGNARRMLSDASMHDGLLLTANDEYKAPPNLWLGATIVNQEEADRDIPKLLSTPAAVRFLSVEPMLGPIDLFWPETLWPDGPRMCCGGHECGCMGQPIDPWLLYGINWVIVGGESGSGARPMHPDWARDLRDQCKAAGVPFLFKQWGEWTPGENVERQRGTVDTAFLWDDEWQIHPLNLATDGGHIDDQPDLYRVGKKAAGRLLDGVTHDGYPEAA